MQIEIGALMTGVVVFGLAAFMPFLIWKLMPIVAAAVVAQGIASAPMRSSQQAMQFAYYGQAAMTRMTSPGAARSGGVASAVAGGGVAAAGPAVVVAAGQAATSTVSWAADGLTSSRLTNSAPGAQRAQARRVRRGDVSADAWRGQGAPLPLRGAAPCRRNVGVDDAGPVDRRRGRRGWRSPGLSRRRWRCRSWRPDCGWRWAGCVAARPTRCCRRWRRSGGDGYGTGIAGAGRSRCSPTVRCQWRCRRRWPGWGCSRST